MKTCMGKIIGREDGLLSEIVKRFREYKFKLILEMYNFIYIVEETNTCYGRRYNFIDMKYRKKLNGSRTWIHFMLDKINYSI